LPELLHHMDGRRRDPERPQETGIAALGAIREKGNMLKLNVFIDGTWLLVQDRRVQAVSVAVHAGQAPGSASPQ
jgi:hypothetical protein